MNDLDPVRLAFVLIALFGSILLFAAAPFLGSGKNYHYKYPVVSPDGTKLAFSSDQLSQGDIYFTENRPSSYTERRMSHHDTSFESQPSWWKNGSLTYFSTHSGKKGIYLVDIERSFEQEAHTLLTPAEFWCEAGKVTGNKLVYSSKRDKQFNIYIMDLTEKKESLVVADGALNLTPHLSPDGKKVVYSSNRKAHFHIWIYTPAEKSFQQMTFHNSGSFMPEFSPDGREVIYTSLESGNNDIWVCDLTTMKHLQITNDKARELAPSWHSDGRSIYYCSDESGKYKIYKRQADWRQP